MNSRLQKLAMAGVAALTSKYHQMEKMDNKLQKLAIAGVAVLTIGVVGRFAYQFVSNPGSHTYKASSESASKPVESSEESITITVLDNTSPTSCSNPLEAVLTQAQGYVNNHSWKEIVHQYAGVPGGVIVSLEDYHGNDKEQACRLALGRLVETTLGSVVDRTHPKYKNLTDLVIKKGLDDCTKDIQLKYKTVRFGL